MQHTVDIAIQAPLTRVFSAAADVVRWPEFMPHCRYNRFVSHKPSGGIIKTSFSRPGIPATWLSEYRIDTNKRRLHFHHLKSTLNITQGMKVVWNFAELPDGSVHVSITHHIRRKLLFLGLPMKDAALMKFLVYDMAAKALVGIKRKVEAQPPAPVIALPSQVPLLTA